MTFRSAKVDFFLSSTSFLHWIYIIYFPLVTIKENHSARAKNNLGNRNSAFEE